MNTPRHSWLAIFIIALVFASGARGDDSGYVRIDLRRLPDNHLVAPARLNGKEAGMVIDTGAFWSCLDSSSDGNFGCRALNGATAMVNGSKQKVAQLASLGLGPMEIHDHKMVLLRMNGLTRGGGSVNGVIGLELLRAGRAIIDCQRLHLFLKAVPSAPDVVGALLRPAGWTAVKLELKDNTYFATGMINHSPARFLVDTGAPVVLLSRSLAGQAGVAETGSRFHTAGINLEDKHAGIGKPAVLAVGGFVLKDYPVAIAGPGMFRNVGSTCNAILGADVLGSNLGVIDCEQGILYLKAPVHR